MIRKILFLVVAGATLCLASGQAVRTVPLDSRGMVYSPSRGLLYVAVASEAPQRAGTLTVVNPFTGALGAFVPLGGDTTAIAMSADERYLYAGLMGGDIVRIDLYKFVPDLVFSTEGTGVETVWSSSTRFREK